MKVGDSVARKSYNKDIVFKITDIIVDENGKKIAILKGVAFRIIADAELSDLEILKPPDIREILIYIKCFQRFYPSIFLLYQVVLIFPNHLILHLLLF